MQTMNEYSFIMTAGQNSATSFFALMHFLIQFGNLSRSVWDFKRLTSYSGRMQIALLYFGVLKDMLGGSSQVVEVPECIDVGGLVRILQERTSNNGMQQKTWDSLAVAVNREYSRRYTVLREGDEVALLPPVSGGCGVEGARR